MRQQRERYITEATSVRSVRQREPELAFIKTQMMGLEQRLTYKKKDILNTVRGTMWVWPV